MDSNSKWNSKTLKIIRILVFIVFLFLAMAKTFVFLQDGLEPYRAVVKTTNLPTVLQYYGVVAILVELYLLFGLWLKRHFRPAIILALGMSVLGTLVNIVLLVFRLDSECGCGLLGDNDAWILLQKGVIIVLLTILLKGETFLFSHNKQL